MGNTFSQLDFAYIWVLISRGWNVCLESRISKNLLQLAKKRWAIGSIAISSSIAAYYLYHKRAKIIQNQQKESEFLPYWIIYNLSIKNNFFNFYRFYQITSSEKDAVDLKKELKNDFEVISSPNIHIKNQGNQEIVQAENREGFKIKEGKIPIFIGWEIAKSALIHLKTYILIPNKPITIISFYKDSQEFRKEVKEEPGLLCIESNLDFDDKNCEQKFIGIIEEVINRAKNKNPPAKNKNPPAELRIPQGLPNIGNTCYMNSLIQVFSIMPGFDDVLNKIKLPIFMPLARILSALRMRDQNFHYREDLIEFQSKIYNHFHMFTPHAQHDTKELFNVLIDEIVSNSEEHQDNFTILITKKFHCEGVHDPEEKKESQLFLVIPRNSLGEFDAHVRMDHYFEGENKLWCETCGDLKDTQLTVETVRYPLNLAIYISGDGVIRELDHNIRLNNEDYHLYAVICHAGSNLFGHYWAHLLIDGKWIKCNDDFVQESSPNLLNCYMLFYSKGVIRLHN